MAAENGKNLEKTASKQQESSGKVEDAKAPLLTNSKKPDTEFNNVLEKKFYKSFMNPMLATLEEKVNENNEILDRINKKWEDEREERKRERLSKHVPEELRGKGLPRNDIFKHLENLIIYENYAKDFDVNRLIKPRQREVDGVAELAVLSQSVASYISLFEPNHLRHLTSTILTDTTRWLCRLFRFDNGTAYFNEDERECLVRISRLSLLKKFPSLTSDGFDALVNKPPVIYISAAARPGLAQYLCAQLSLPLWCVNTIPCTKKVGAQNKMDISLLEKAIAEDQKENRCPTLVICYAGTPLIGHVDDIGKMQDICSKHNIWLHVEGANLATLVLYSVPTSINSAKTGDSISLNLSSWFGLPLIPHVVLYKEQDPNDSHAAGLIQVTNKSRLCCLGLWMCLQEMGHEGMVERVQGAVTLANYLVEKLNKLKQIRHLSKRASSEEEKNEMPDSIGGVAKQLVTKAINALVTFEIENPTVVFQYYPDLTSSSSEKEVEKGKEKEREREKKEKIREADKANDKEIKNALKENNDDSISYLHSLNIWLVETIKREIGKVFLSAVDVEAAGACIRFAPLETAHAMGTTTGDIDALVACIERQLPILNATIEMRKEFDRVVSTYANLNLIKVQNWAGLGAVQYVPDGYLNRQWSDDDMKNINTLNIGLVHELKSRDTAFSLGFDNLQTACVRFGLVTNATDLEELVGLVVSKAKEVEEASRYLEIMADVVKQGIEKAELELVEEHQKKLASEGVLRQVPLVSSLMNWWSPPPKEGMKGRTFLLSSGKILSTEPIYKYRIQVKEEDVKGGDSEHAKLYENKSSIEKNETPETNVATPEKRADTVKKPESETSPK
ncbi:DgyrCDS11803 [Dimorphilus gyrociliatus]|uniref:Pyridoxal-dependent decarboxylase domain-containing protein 1 n=1 Tax=Dimorphilus gyrociliatus TaxID=2664684 RepID=A0A7I8W724_9ANNE|nr:DgyrCDS11803 [Dimorphilus gyrociliatus]